MGVLDVAGALYPSRITGALYNVTTTAASTATRYATRKLTQKTFKVALRKALMHLCVSFDLDDYGDESGDGCTSVVARNLVLKSAPLNALLARLGWRLADIASMEQPCTISSVRLVISWRARKDLGLFSEPWRLEIDDLCLDLRVGAARDGWGRPVAWPTPVEAEVKPNDAADTADTATAAAATAAADIDSDEEETQWFDAEDQGDVGEFFAGMLAAEIGDEGSSNAGEEEGAAEAPAGAAAQQATAEVATQATALLAEPAAEAAASETAEAAAGEAAAAAPAAAPKPDMLPLHRAAENLRLVLRSVRLRFFSDTPLAGDGTGRSELLLGLQVVGPDRRRP